MSKKKKYRYSDASPSKKKRCSTFLTTADGFSTLCASGYTPLNQNPEVVTACRRIADMISSMTIYLMANTEKGDQRIKNEMSRMIDITPSKYMTRKTWMDAIVMNLLLHGRGNSIVLPHTSGGLLTDLEVIPPGEVSFLPDGRGYKVSINGAVYDPGDLLHFTLNPSPDQPWRGEGYTAALRDVVRNLHQAAKTENGFMADKWKPSLIVKIDGLVDEFSSPDGRRKLLEEYISTGEAGEPWMIPADQLSVEQIKPLSLADLALNDAVEIDKKTVAAIMGVPSFVLGVGTYTKDEWDCFVSNIIRSLVRGIEQELTKKLLLSPKWYWKFNIHSLYSYDLQTTAEVFRELYKSGLVTGNEVRDRLGMAPLDGLDKLVVLENYIPLDRIGDQKKLMQEEAI